MKKYIYALFILISFIALNYGASAQNIVQLSFYAPLISTFEMKYTSNHLVVSQNGLLIFDVSNPNVRPTLLSQTPYPGNTANQLAVQGNYAYMSHGNNGIFVVYDISNFSAPVLTGSVAIPATSFSGSGDLEPHGNYVYLAGFDSLYVIDVSDAAAPQVVKALTVTHTAFSGAGEIVIDRNTLFIRTPLGIDGYNITNPVNPLFFGSMTPLHAFSTGLEIDTVNHRIFSPWVSPLQEFTGHDAYDVSNPRSPQFLFSDSVEIGSGEYGVTGYSYIDTVLYISRSNDINAFDVKPATHHFVTNFSGQDVANAIVSIQVKDSVFYDAKRGGLEVLKYSNTLPALCNTPAILKTRVNGTTAYLAWNRVKGAKGYVVRYRKFNGRWTYDSSLNNVQVLTNLEPNTLYYWEVTAVCGLRPRFNSDFSLTERFNTGTANDIISIAPNPVHDIFRINIYDATVEKIVIADFTGNIVRQLPHVKSGQQVSFASLPAGVYIIQAFNHQNLPVEKISFFKE